MKCKKIIPLALALTAAATVSAGASNLDVVKLQMSETVILQAQQQALHQLCGKYGVSLCGWQTSCPTVKPEVKPEQTPDDKPEVKPEQTPDDKPEVKPEQTPDQTPDVKPEQTPPEQTPDTKPEQTPGGNGGAVQGDLAAQVVRLVNAERAKNGLSALTVNAKVQQAAQVRAKEQAQSFSHTRPNGASCFTALTEAGVSYRGAGENIAYGQQTAQDVMTAWMNSAGHRANILNANFTNIGVGYTVINGTPYWAQMFTY